jgi:hypothetical protein
LQSLLTEHRGWQQLEAAEVGTTAKPRTSRAKPSRKIFFMRQFSLMDERAIPLIL